MNFYSTFVDTSSNFWLAKFNWKVYDWKENKQNELKKEQDSVNQSI